MLNECCWLAATSINGACTGSGSFNCIELSCTTVCDDVACIDIESKYVMRYYIF